jgi:hypothetical protein
VVNTPEFAKAQRQRKKLETLFVELTNQIGRRRLRLREVEVRAEQFLLAAVAQTIKRLVRFLSQPPNPVLPVTRLGRSNRREPWQGRRSRLRRPSVDPLFQHFTEC